ncbi:MAG: hypothetical protein H7Y38_16405 [Armatimonadetes bacterium]|nr:hypothetical protein [Armatimonadota bacterium]
MNEEKFTASTMFTDEEVIAYLTEGGRFSLDDYRLSPYDLDADGEARTYSRFAEGTGWTEMDDGTGIVSASLAYLKRIGTPFASRKDNKAFWNGKGWEMKPARLLQGQKR